MWNSDILLIILDFGTAINVCNFLYLEETITRIQTKKIMCVYELFIEQTKWQVLKHYLFICCLFYPEINGSLFREILKQANQGLSAFWMPWLNSCESLKIKLLLENMRVFKTPTSVSRFTGWWRQTTIWWSFTVRIRSFINSKFSSATVKCHQVLRLLKLF